jgi:gluconokinase
MPASLLDSQLATLEPPQVDEQALALDIQAPAQALADAAHHHLLHGAAA